MKTAVEIYYEVELEFDGIRMSAKNKTLHAMEIYAEQFKTKHCSCIEQETDLQNIAENGTSNND